MPRILRLHGHFVMGPIDHGMCLSIYATAPEGLMIEFATNAAPIDADAWIDPEVVTYRGIDAAELARYRRPAAFASRRGTVPHEEIAAVLSVPAPPVPGPAGQPG